MSKAQMIGIAAGAAAAISWGSATVFSKDLLQQFEPVSLLLIQLGTSVVFLWALVICRTKWAQSEAPSLRKVAPYAWLGALEPALAYLLCLSGLVSATASGATLIQAAESIMIVGVTATITRKLPSGEFIGLSLVALAALYFALGIESDDSPGDNSPLGIVLLSAGTLSAAIYVVLSGRVAHRAPAITIIAWQQSVALALTVSATVVLRPHTGVPHAAADATLIREIHVNAKILILCALSGLMQFAVPFSLYMVALQRLPANVAGAMLLVTPLAGLLEAHAFLGEQLTMRQWMGSLVALAAVAGLGVIGSQTKAVAAPSPIEP
jgi:drug/metabolite transporter (DMT)-like permease